MTPEQAIEELNEWEPRMEGTTYREAVDVLADALAERDDAVADAVNEALRETVLRSTHAAITGRLVRERDAAVSERDALAQDRDEYIDIAERLGAERDKLRDLVERAASIFDDHIDYPQAVSHAELRATAREFRAALGSVAPAATKGEEHAGSCRIFYAERVCTCGSVAPAKERQG